MATEQELAEISRSINTILDMEELKQFDKTYKEIVKRLIAHNTETLQEDGDVLVKTVNDWLTKVMRYNALGGKMLRGLMVPMAYKTLMKRNVSVEQMQLAYALGWVLEMLQAASLVADDMMDQSEMRRGKPCWYKQPYVGLTAVNDCLVLTSAAFVVLDLYFEKQPYYRDLYDKLHEVLFFTIFGQALDCHTEKCDDIVESYTMDRYNTIVLYKTSYYTMYLPVICGMILAGKANDTGLVYQVEAIMLQLGHYFQVQDDYLDCFGDKKKTGKVGTDIQDNKCSWLFVKAIELSTPEDLEILLENYGKDNMHHIETVKKMYRNLGLKQAYYDYEDEIYGDIVRRVGNLPEDFPRDFFNELLSKLYKRNV